MARVKRAVNGKKHRRAVLEQAQGYYGNRSRSFRSANEAVMHSLQYAYRDRRARKGDFRRLWIQRINAAARANGTSYSRLIAGLREAEVVVDRKVLADLAVTDPEAFSRLVGVATSALADGDVDPGGGGGRGPLLTTALAFRHQRVQRVRRLLARRSTRRSEGAFVVEGVKLLESALEAGAPVEAVFVDDRARTDADVAAVLDTALDRGARVFDLAPGVIERVADTVTPQPVLAVVAMPTATLAELAGMTFVVVCVDVRDPGNAGAVIRVAHAAGAGAVVCSEGTVDPFNPKTVRASAGSVLHIPVVVAGDAGAVLDALAEHGLRRLAAVSRGGARYTDVDMTSPFALVLGNEASGLPPQLAQRLDTTVTIPMGGGAESLNVSTAAAVLCFESARQRSILHAMGEAR